MRKQNNYNKKRQPALEKKKGDSDFQSCYVVMLKMCSFQ